MLFVILFIAGFLASSAVLTAMGQPTIFNKFQSRKDRAALETRAVLAVEAAHQISANDPIMCSMYEVRMTQQKMVDAGILNQWDLSNCENEDCNNCYVTRGYGYGGPRVPRFVEPRKIIDAPDKFTERKRDVRGEIVNIPEGVPDNAHAAIKPFNENFFYIFWTWLDEETGSKMGTKSIHPKSQSFIAGRKIDPPRRPMYRSNATINELRARNKELKKMLEETKKQTQAYKNAKAGMCGCDTYDISVDSDLTVASFKSYTCDYHKEVAVKRALAKSPVRKTGDMGPR